MDAVAWDQGCYQIRLQTWQGTRPRYVTLLRNLMHVYCSRDEDFTRQRIRDADTLPICMHTISYWASCRPTAFLLCRF